MLAAENSRLRAELDRQRNLPPPVIIQQPVQVNPRPPVVAMLHECFIVHILLMVLIPSAFLRQWEAGLTDAAGESWGSNPDTGTTGLIFNAVRRHFTLTHSVNYGLECSGWCERSWHIELWCLCGWSRFEPGQWLFSFVLSFPYNFLYHFTFLPKKQVLKSDICPIWGSV